MIQFFNTEAAYNAAAKNSFESAISLIGENNTVKYDGRNVVVGARSAKTGSICVLDGNSAMHFISVGTYNSNSFFSNFTVVGPVLVGVDHPDFRGTIVIGNKAHDNKVWSYIYSWRLTGYTLDGTDRTGVLSVRDSSDSYAANHDYAISYNASTAAELAAQLNTYFRNNAPFSAQDWVAEVVTENESQVINLVCHYLSYQQANSNSGKTGFTLTANLLPGITASTAIHRLNGQRTGEGTIINWPRAVAYFRADNTSTSYNPSADVTSPKRSYPVCLPAYLGTSQHQSDHCAALRAIYGEGEAGWLKYMATFLPVRPSEYGQLGNKETYGDTYSNTYKMAGKTFTKHDNTTVSAFPAADYCASVSYNHELLARGRWAMPDIDLVFSIMKTIKYPTTNSRNADPINAAYYAIGGNALSNGAYLWSCSRGGAYGAWFFYGGVGCAIIVSLNLSYRALPVVLLNLDELEAA